MPEMWSTPDMGTGKIIEPAGGGMASAKADHTPASITSFAESISRGLAGEGDFKAEAHGGVRGNNCGQSGNELKHEESKICVRGWFRCRWDAH